MNEWINEIRLQAQMKDKLWIIISYTTVSLRDRSTQTENNRLHPDGTGANALGATGVPWKPVFPGPFPDSFPDIEFMS